MFSPTLIDKNIALKAEVMIRAAKLRITKQRCAVLQTILESCDHPTASQIYQRTQQKSTGISLATVYNCLESMSEARIINQLHVNNGPSRYCSNETPHAHVVDEEGREILDIHLKKGIELSDVFELPQHICVQAVDIYLRTNAPQPL